MKKFSKKVTAIAWSLLCCLVLTSCNDEKLARQMEGTWKGSYSANYGDGNERVVQTMTFHYDEESIEDDGTFVEELSGTIRTTDLDEVDGTLTCRYRFRITGRWSVDIGDLNLTYNLNDCEIEIKKSDVNLHLNNFEDHLAMKAYERETGYDLLNDIVKEARKEVYDELRQQYQQHNAEDGTFANLKVTDNELSFETNDLGRMTFRRVR